MFFKTGGTFIEAGAFDGIFFSNTLYLELFRSWSGLLVEPHPDMKMKLLSHNRKVWFLPGCLSLEPYPTKVSYGESLILTRMSKFRAVSYKGKLWGKYGSYPDV